MTAPSFVPRHNADFVITGQAQLWWKPWVYGTPAAFPADTVLLGGAWLAPWAPIGATREGVTARFAREVTNINIEEVPNPVDQRTSNATFTFTAQLSEDTLNTMLLAYGGGTIATIAAGPAVKGKKILTISPDLTYVSIGFESVAPPRAAVTDEIPWRRMVIDKVSSAAEVETPFRRSEGQRVYPVTFTSLTPIQQCPIQELDADVTA